MDVIKLKWGHLSGLKSKVTGVLIKGGLRTQRHIRVKGGWPERKGEYPTKTEADMGTPLPEAKEHLGLPKARKSKERSFP